jgi:DNA-binding transcriptional ArsR family regulator
MERTGYERLSDPLTATFAALADPTRRAILARLATGDANVTELARPFAMSQPAISRHLKVLERAGLISRGRDAQSRPCHLEGSRMREAIVWMERFRGFWESSFDRLDALLVEMKQDEAHAAAARPAKTMATERPTKTLNPPRKEKSRARKK